mgnify:CR=1 FL=1
MIVINKIKSREEGNDLILSSLLEIDETKFDLLVKLGIVIDYIVEDVKGQRRIPRLPYNSVEYPECDAVINCNIRYPKLSRRKIEERTNNRIIDVGEILDLRECL